CGVWGFWVLWLWLWGCLCLFCLLGCLVCWFWGFVGGWVFRCVLWFAGRLCWSGLWVWVLLPFWRV
ncbi:hypothetical protein, partial [Pseudomonas syringae group genomosp. 7]|uniref:hypothetical protein n=1 Tax=Pseudomonas syringae group genomosp. 7 TaxID=251699 RepID=UPI00376F88C1